MALISYSWLKGIIGPLSPNALSGRIECVGNNVSTILAIALGDSLTMRHDAVPSETISGVQQYEGFLLIQGKFST